LELREVLIGGLRYWEPSIASRQASSEILSSLGSSKSRSKHTWDIGLSEERRTLTERRHSSL